MYKPNFFVVGAAKSGTSALADYIDQHPQIAISSVKEPFYFISDYGMKNEQEYLSLFKDTSNASARGDASTGYLYDRESPQRIKAFCPDAKIIIILRNPVDMVFSYWRYMRVYGNESCSFDQAISEKESQYRKTKDFKEQCRNWWASYIYIDRASYASQVARYIETFGGKNVKVYYFERFIKQPTEICQDIFRFLDVDDNFVPNIKVVNEGGEPRSDFLRAIGTTPYPFLKATIPVNLRNKIRKSFKQLNRKKGSKSRMTESQRAHLEKIFQNDIAELEEIVGEEIEEWRPKSAVSVMEEVN